MSKHTVESVYKQFHHLVFFICFKYMRDNEQAKDAVSEVFTDLLEHPEKLDNVQHLKAWLPVFTKHKCLYLLKCSKTERNKLIQYFDYEQSNSLSSQVHFNFYLEKEQRHTKGKLFEDLKHALNDLKENHRSCIVLYYLEKKSYKEIMSFTNYTFRQVDNYLYYGKRKLVKILSAYGWTDDNYKKLFQNK